MELRVLTEHWKHFCQYICSSTDRSVNMFTPPGGAELVTSLAVMCISAQLMEMRGLASSSPTSAATELADGARGANSEFAAAETVAVAMALKRWSLFLPTTMVMEIGTRRIVGLFTLKVLWKYLVI